MQASEEPDGALLLTYDSSLWTKWLIGAALVLLGTAVYDYFIGARGEDRLIGLLAGAATLAVTAVVMLEQCRFRIDPIARIIESEQRWGFRRRGGITPFDDVAHVSTEVPIGDSGIPSRRIVLHLVNGALLPLTVGYKPDVDEAISRAAALLRAKLGQHPQTTAESIRLLIAQGRAIDAIKLLVEKEGLSPTDAKQRVDRIKDE
jgi:hypothetical protein